MTLTGGTVKPMTPLRAILAAFDRETIVWGLYKAAGRLTAAVGDLYASLTGQDRAEATRLATEGRTRAEVARMIADSLPKRDDAVIEVGRLRRSIRKYAADCDAYALDLERMLGQ